MRWLLRLVLLRVLGTRVVLALAVLAWFRSVLQRGRAASLRRQSVPPAGERSRTPTSRGR